MGLIRPIWCLPGNTLAEPAAPNLREDSPGFAGRADGELTPRAVVAVGTLRPGGMIVASVVSRVLRFTVAVRPAQVGICGLCGEKRQKSKIIF
jgi:hypothetical protein